MKSCIRVLPTLALIAQFTLHVLPAVARERVIASVEPAPQLHMQLTHTIIPVGSALIVTVPQEQVIDIGNGRSTQLTLPLAQPLFDRNGRTIIPANALVQVVVQPRGNQTVLVAEQLVYEGRVLDIAALGRPLSEKVITRSSGIDRASTTAPVGGKMGGALGGLLGADTRSIEVGALFGTLFGAVSGIAAPEDLRVVQLPAGSLHVLTLLKDLDLDSQSVPANGGAEQ
jgi:hypothetical protein